MTEDIVKLRDIYFNKGTIGVAEYLAVSKYTARYHLHKLGLGTRKSLIEKKNIESLVPKSRNPFLTPSCEGNYLLGYILGDGSIADLDRRNPRLVIVSKDKEILEKFQGIFNYGHIGTLNKGKYESYRLILADKPLIQSLLDRGLVPNKSEVGCTVKYDTEYKYDFLRGLIDSDGCVSKKNDWVAVSIYGHRLTIDQVVRGFPEINFYRYQRNSKLHSLWLRKKDDVKKLYDSLYYDGCICLERKRRKYTELK